MSKAKAVGLIRRDALKKREPADLFKAMAMDVAKEVAHHIEIMYPKAVEATGSTFLLSVRGCVYDEIMAAARPATEDEIVARLERKRKFRRHLKAVYKKIRKD